MLLLTHDPNIDPDAHLPIARRARDWPSAGGLSPQARLIQAEATTGERAVPSAPLRRKFGARGQVRVEGQVQASGSSSSTAWRGSAGGEIEIFDKGNVERLVVHPKLGPEVYLKSGDIGYLAIPGGAWDELASSDQKLLAYQAVRRNRSMIDWKGEAFWRPELLRSPEELVAERCKAEMAKPAVPWRYLGIQDVMANHARRAPGRIYGLEFPWNEEMLFEFGAAWLTKAFHAAGTLDKKNSVTKVSREAHVKITAGNNAGKFLFEVTYARQEPGLHTKLFAKVPFAMTKETQTDRISSSVYKQPADLSEINTYRLLEASLPVKTPKYYFGDISNETSNFILITERIPFRGVRGRLKPKEVEGPYDKCKDWQLQGAPHEYYLLLMRASGKIAGAHKAGAFGKEDFLFMNHFNQLLLKDTPQAWGVDPDRATGEDAAACRRKLEAAYKFISQIAKPLFPDYASTDEFQEKFMRTLLLRNAYNCEIEFFKNSDPDYVALGHMNLNADNAYYWRDARGELDCGVIDWGGFGVNCLGHKLWWIINCADFDHVSTHLVKYVDAFIESYVSAGGPPLDREVVMSTLLLTSLGNTMFMVAAVPNCYTMCAAEEFASIASIRDPRVSENIFGKSTLRTTLHVMNNGIRVIEELQADKALDNFVHGVYEKKWGLTAKNNSLVFGT